MFFISADFLFVFRKSFFQQIFFISAVFFYILFANPFFQQIFYFRRFFFSVFLFSENFFVKKISRKKLITLAKP